MERISSNDITVCKLIIVPPDATVNIFFTQLQEVSLKKSTPKKYQVKWLKKALADLDGSLSYTESNHGLAVAEQLAKVLFEAVDNIVDNPGRGRLGRFTGTRELVILSAPYVIPYRVVGTQVQILRVFHTSKKPPNLRW